VSIANLAAHLKELERGGVKLAIIDTPPAVTETIRVVGVYDSCSTKMAEALKPFSFFCIKSSLGEICLIPIQ
jgi:anti-anti-sigma regulatory factor